MILLAARSGNHSDVYLIVIRRFSKLRYINDSSNLYSLSRFLHKNMQTDLYLYSHPIYIRIILFSRKSSVHSSEKLIISPKCHVQTFEIISLPAFYDLPFTNNIIVKFEVTELEILINNLILWCLTNSVISQKKQFSPTFRLRKKPLDWINIYYIKHQ